MKLILWNVYKGFADGTDKGMLPNPDRELKICSWIAKQQPDVVALLELNGHNQRQLSVLSERWGHNHYQIVQGQFPLALTSATTLNRPAWNTQELTHGFLSVEIKGTRFVLCHIPPVGEHSTASKRASELRAVLKHIIPYLDSNTPMMLLGDLNGDHDDRFVQGLMAVGLHDQLVSDPARKDYALCNDSLLDRCSMQWIRSAALQKLSDHFPLVVEISPLKNPRS